MEVGSQPVRNLPRQHATAHALIRGSFEGKVESRWASGFAGRLDAWMEQLYSCPWGAHAGLSPWGAQYQTSYPAEGWNTQGSASNRPESFDFRKKTTASKTRRQLYTAAERLRRDASGWTVVQGVLAPLQFAICAASLLLIVRYLTTGQGYALATGSILLKTAALYAIMITGSIWEKEVFGQWLFARAFFWEDAVSMVVLALQTTYVAALLNGWGTPAEQMSIAIAAYVAYAVNASQFLLKLRAARQDAAPGRSHAVAA